MRENDKYTFMMSWKASGKVTVRAKSEEEAQKKAIAVLRDQCGYQDPQIEHFVEAGE